MGSVVLLTGATGFVGTEIASRLLDRRDLTLVCLVQAANDDAALRDARRAWYGRGQLPDAIGARIEIVPGDVTRPSFGLAPDAYAALVGRLTHIVHAAATVRFDASLEDLRRTNVGGTANALALARAVHADHGLERLLHVSTAYVAGRRRGEVGEDDLSDRFGFENDYERTKYEAERLVRDAMTDLPITVVRPAMIVGDSRTGDITTFNTFYLPLRHYLAQRPHVVPVSPRLRVNIVPVDHVADAVVTLLDDPRAEGCTVHLTAPRASLPTASEVMRSVRSWARTELRVRLPRPIMFPLPRVPLPRSATRLRILMPYLHERRTFRRDHADRLLGPYEPRWQSYLPALLRFAVARGFLHRSGRTVHEQAMFRLRSGRLPVRYLDVVDGRRHPRSAADVRADVLAAARCLRAVGVGRGTRVAIVGPNGTRYVTLEIAVGLLGAVSVPLYATTPPDEIDAILRASRAEALLVGSPRILDARGPVARSLPTASFCRGAPPAGVLGWDDLTADREDVPEIDRAPVDLDDVATLRYTSGTTGFPKGVAFTHGQLVWMAETIASLVPWRARTKPVVLRVVPPDEPRGRGDHGHLRAVRDAGAGRGRVRRGDPRGARCPPCGPPDRVLLGAAALREGLGIGRGHRDRAALRRDAGRGREAGVRGASSDGAVLRRAGLDRCAQLIVGSARVPEGLLEHLRELGIEVHNAYGLTEAPLLTMNRPGRNRIGTVGEPLPATTVRIAEDGEVLARGPQVTVGYADADATQPFRDGWLATGDLGRIDDGFLVIEGRKKELLKTSYGKYLNAAKIEARLCAIAGVTNAMVVGEARPYCAALLWVDGEPDDRRDGVGAAIAEVNGSLSHPEQVKRWAVLADDLSIPNGDLTPNLKLRRRGIEERFADVIAGLYAREEVRT